MGNFLSILGGGLITFVVSWWFFTGTLIHAGNNAPRHSLGVASRYRVYRACSTERLTKQ
jgi:hypothetical protein